ncbi:transcriptional regulator [Vibrio sp. NTOU-M3]|uniref:winged helix-turn-helix domain-containing protein n=1 Tax=Vibrio sp. NTOU-M3 TaxID=3234954 RepID=UPI00349FCDBE
MYQLIYSEKVIAFQGAEESSFSKTAPLTDIEFAVVEQLMKSYPEPCSQDELLDCWAGRIVSNNSLRVLINGLRSHLSKICDIELIKTKRSVGYYLDKPIYPIEEIEIASDLPVDKKSTELHSNYLNTIYTYIVKSDLFHNKFFYYNIVFFSFELLLVTLYERLFC